MRLVITLATLLLIGADAKAGLSRLDLSHVSVSLPPAARLEPALTAPDETGRQRSVGEILGGRPGFVTFVDYNCTTLCGPDLMLLSAALERAHLPAPSFRVIAIGLNPKATFEAARAMKEAEIPPDMRDATVFLLPSAELLGSAAKALGFRYAYDATTDQFAHPAVVYVTGPAGSVRSTFSPFASPDLDLRALVDQTHSLNLGERVRLLCYAYDPATGRYNVRIVALLRIAGFATVVLLGGGLFALLRLRRRTA